MAGHSRSKNGVASLAYSRSKNGVASLAYVSRPSTSLCLLMHQDVDARDKRGHDSPSYPAATSDKENPAIRL
jgi:hypothetical protein